MNNMNKETILKEFDNKFDKRIEEYCNYSNDYMFLTLYSEIKDEFIKSIDQTKKETIKDIIKKINEVSKTNIDLTAYGEGFEYAIDLINNKLKN